MPLDIPTRREVVSQAQAYSRTHLPELDPTVTRRRGFIGGLYKSLGSALRDLYAALKRFADYEPWVQSATENFLLSGWWLQVTQLTRNPASPARGRLIITGVSGTVINAASVLTSGRATYLVDSSQVVVTQSLLIASMTRNGSKVIVETVAAVHDLATGMSLTIAGATQTDYNGAHVITVTAPNEFTFTIATTPVTPATGTIYAQGTWGNVNVTCTATGVEGNLDADAVLEISSPPVGLDPAAIVTFGGLGGGAELEDLELFRARLMEALGTDYGMFSAAEIKILAKQVPGVTRVWVKKAQLYEGTPVYVYEGQVKIAFVRDGDANIFPSAQEVATVKNYIVERIAPAHTAEEDIMVMSPEARPLDFTFLSLTPDTASMRRAIRASLEQFFNEAVEYSETVYEDAYRCAIMDAWDAERRQSVKSFTINESGDAVILNNQLPVLGTITWPT